MPRFSSVAALGDPSTVHLLEFEIDSEVLGGVKATDPFDSDRLREAANLMKRVCTKQALAGAYAVSSVRDGLTMRFQCGFISVVERNAVADLARGEPLEAAPWASRRFFVLDAERLENLSAAGVPRDNKGPGRRAREKARNIEVDLGPRWKVYGPSR